jgi:hypothetical protein
MAERFSKSSNAASAELMTNKCVPSRFRWITLESAKSLRDNLKFLRELVTYYIDEPTEHMSPTGDSWEYHRCFQAEEDLWVQADKET